MISYSSPSPERSGNYQLGLRAMEQVSTEFDTEDCHGHILNYFRHHYGLKDCVLRFNFIYFVLFLTSNRFMQTASNVSYDIYKRE